MMLIILTIILSSFLTLAFKVLQRMGIPTFQSIVFNYITCVLVGSLVNGAYPVGAIRSGEQWLGWALLMGTLFIGLFNVIAFVTRQLGVAIASVSNKLSLVIPFLFSILWFQDNAGWLNYVGIVLALLAVVLTCWPHQAIKGSTLPKTTGWLLLVPAGLFLGSGLLDTLITFTERQYLHESNKDAFLILAFSTAGLFGLLILAGRILMGKERVDRRAVVAGLAIGIPNYFSIQTLMMALDQFPGQSSVVVPVVNIGIVLFSTVVAFYVFREKLSKLNWLGILFSVLAIALMSTS